MVTVWRDAGQLRSGWQIARHLRRAIHPEGVRLQIFQYVQNFFAKLLNLPGRKGSRQD